MNEQSHLHIWQVTPGVGQATLAIETDSKLDS